MKKRVLSIVTIMLATTVIASHAMDLPPKRECSLSIKNDGNFATIYVSTKKGLPDVITKKGLKNNAIKIDSNQTGTLKVGIEFFVYTPAEKNNFKKHFQIVVKPLCFKDPNKNFLSYRDIKEGTFDRKRYQVINLRKKRKGSKSEITVRHKGQPLYIMQPGGYADILP